MTAIWQNDGDAWKLITPVGFPAEAALHDLVAQSPEMLPLSGNPRVVVLGREVPLGNGWADILAIEDNGRPVVIEVKLERNSEARRAVVAQVLDYAAHLQGMSPAALNDALAGTIPGIPLREAVESALGDLQGWDEVEDKLSDSLAQGWFRLVLVLDGASDDLVRLVGYLEQITNEQIIVDLIIVESYTVGNTQVVIPRRIDPRNNEGPSVRLRNGTSASRRTVVDGPRAFEEFFPEVDAEYRERLGSLTNWAKRIEARGDTLLRTTIGGERRVLRMEVPGEKSTIATIWAQKRSPCIGLETRVVARRAPGVAQRLQERFPDKATPYLPLEDVDDEVLRLIEAAYAEAAAGKLNVSS